MKKEIKIKDKVCYIKSPTNAQLKSAGLKAGQVFADAVKNGFLLKAKTVDVLKEQGLWGDKQLKELTEVTERIKQNELTLKRGGIKKSEAKEIAFTMREDRHIQNTLLGVLNSLDGKTAEGLSTDARFDYLCSVCIVDEEGKPLCKSMEDYQDRANDAEDPQNELLNEAATEFSAMFFGYDKDWQLKLPENAFFKEQGMVDKDFRLINKEGKWVDYKGRLVNEKFQLINNEGKAIDENGNLIDENGERIVEFVPFIDDDIPSKIIETEQVEQSNIDKVISA